MDDSHQQIDDDLGGAREFHGTRDRLDLAGQVCGLCGDGSRLDESAGGRDCGNASRYRLFGRELTLSAKQWRYRQPASQTPAPQLPLWLPPRDLRTMLVRETVPRYARRNSMVTIASGTQRL